MFANSDIYLKMDMIRKELEVAGLLIAGDMSIMRSG